MTRPLSSVAASRSLEKPYGSDGRARILTAEGGAQRPCRAGTVLWFDDPRSQTGTHRAHPHCLWLGKHKKSRKRLPCLFLPDEFAALGHLEAVVRAIGLIADYGLQLWPILQEMSQLKNLYGDRAGTFKPGDGPSF
ncbi:type IV secretory system conjugative DNA transfer family protein [Tateyamaria sp. SN6-1]|uniref:type IV secretory system conjugative DNA transfer family protein n=1 Tax=Tateyamaria sp. SN6-1 TaxID=3092148 RepID=UPI0039F4B80A